MTAILIFFCRALGAVDLRADLLSAPLRRAPHVHDEPVLGSVLLSVRVRRAGPVVPQPARATRSCIASTTRSPTPSAIRTRRCYYGNVGSMMWETKQHYDAYAYRRARAGAALPRRHARVAAPRPPVAELGRARRPRRALRRLLPARSRRRWLVPALAGPLADGPDPRRHRQLVRPQVRLPQLRARATPAATRCRSTS